MGDRANRAFAAVVPQHLKPKLLLPGSHFNLPQTTLPIIGKSEGRVGSRSRSVGWLGLTKQDQKLFGVVVPIFNPTKADPPFAGRAVAAQHDKDRQPERLRGFRR